MLLEAHCRRALWFILTVLIHGPSCNVYYPGFKRNFWLEFSSPSPSSPAPPPPTHPPPPRPLFLSPGRNGSVQTVTLGRTTHIDCMVSNLHGHQVSWIRRRENEMSLLTTDRLVFSADNRYSVVQDTVAHNWRLVIQSAQERDTASYLCQVNTHPPATLLVQLIVIVPELTAVDDQGQPVSEKYFKPGSTILLRCLVTNYRPDFQAPVWRRGDLMVTTDNQKRNRVRVEYGQDGSLESRLYLTGADKADTGRYSCHIPGLSQVAPASVNLHITQGEETAAIQSLSSRPKLSLALLGFLLLLGPFQGGSFQGFQLLHLRPTPHLLLLLPCVHQVEQREK